MAIVQRFLFVMSNSETKRKKQKRIFNVMMSQNYLGLNTHYHRTVATFFWSLSTHRNTATGKTALHVASMQNNVEAVLSLTDAGADAGARDKEGITPLLAATQKGYGEVVTALITPDSVGITDAQGMAKRPGTLAVWMCGSCLKRSFLSAKREHFERRQSKVVQEG